MTELKRRLLNGWNWVRIMYIVMGVYILVQSIGERQWIWTLFGVYFTSMGLFGFGCAAGNCYTNFQNKKIKENNENDMDGIEFEEIKEK